MNKGNLKKTLFKPFEDLFSLISLPFIFVLIPSLFIREEIKNKNYFKAIFIAWLYLSVPIILILMLITGN